LTADDYPPIAAYAYIGDCHSAALISRSGSIDWCCMPRVDSQSCFGRLLDWSKGGYCRIAPADDFEVSRGYLDRTLVLETTFRTATGEARVLDCFTMREGGEHSPHQQILRVMEGVQGTVRLALDIAPGFNFGTVKPWIRQTGEREFQAIGGAHGLFISGDCPLSLRHRHLLSASLSLEQGQRARLSLLYRQPEDLDEGLVEAPTLAELDRRLEETIAWWRRWISRGDLSGPYEKYLRRSAMVLKGLSNAPTGAIAAAPTTSLPETLGGSRNWDYRFSWIRDSIFTIRSLAELGFRKEADGFRRFVERSAAGSSEQIQILFGVGGERRLHEYEIPELEGYRGSRPVRVGNAAHTQVQLDVYGELLDLAWRWHNQGNAPDEDYWEFLVELVNDTAKRWTEPDRGIWEIRGEPRHFVHSKAMCWGALDRGIKLAQELGREAPLDTWQKAAAEIWQAIETKGYDRQRGVFVQAFDHHRMDAALLLLPSVGLVEYQDERMVRTVDAIREELAENGLVRRYLPDDDGLEGREGVFIACSFWLAECLARQQRLESAHEVFQRALATGNDLKLFSEEFDPNTGEMLGNFPQGLTHLSLIAAAVALADMEKK